MLPHDHPAVYCFKLLFKKLPKFTLNTPIPYKPHTLTQLHKDNINAVINHLYLSNLPIPDNLNHSNQHTYKLLHETNNIKQQKFQYFKQLRKLLEVYNLTLTPADKTNHLVVLPLSTLCSELEVHLQDKLTYKLISEDEHSEYRSLQLQMVNDAKLFYKKPNLLTNKPSNRYIYMLPKIHKDYNDWRSPHHPKMRPIISDTGSITCKLANLLLKELQKIERNLATTVTSSLSTAYNINILNSNENRSTVKYLATIDVDSLFTKIPQSSLLQIINSQLMSTIKDNKSREKFMQYIEIIIKYNTFQVNEKYYLQTIGLPMGGALSGTLANIYLGVTEHSISQIHGILLFNRYMDDILLITNFTDTEVKKYIENLQNIYKLNLTNTYNKETVNFLDMTITYSKTNNCFTIYPFSKNYIKFPLPAINDKRPFKLDANIIKSQLLRAWRFSTSDYYFSRTIKQFMAKLGGNVYYDRLNKHISEFLSPITKRKKEFTTKIPLCDKCIQTVNNNKINVVKILKVEENYVAIKEPINCKTKNIHIIIQEHNSTRLTTVILTLSLHEFVNKNTMREYTIMPIGKINESKLINILKKNNTIQYIHKNYIMKKKSTRHCYIHPIFNKPYYIYRCRTNNRKKPTIGSMLNKYKKISRINNQ